MPVAMCNAGKESKKKKNQSRNWRVSKVQVKNWSPCHDSDTALSFSFPFLDGGGNERLGELDAGLTMLSEDSLRGREGVGLPNDEMLSRGEVTGWDGDSPPEASVSKNSTQSREKD